jgi:hypothetical protein
MDFLSPFFVSFNRLWCPVHCLGRAHKVALPHDDWKVVKAVAHQVSRPTAIHHPVNLGDAAVVRVDCRGERGCRVAGKRSVLAGRHTQHIPTFVQLEIGDRTGEIERGDPGASTACFDDVARAPIDVKISRAARFVRLPNASSPILHFGHTTTLRIDGGNQRGRFVSRVRQ